MLNGLIIGSCCSKGSLRREIPVDRNRQIL